MAQIHVHTSNLMIKHKTYDVLHTTSHIVSIQIMGKVIKQH